MRHGGPAFWQTAMRWVCGVAVAVGLSACTTDPIRYRRPALVIQPAADVALIPSPEGTIDVAVAQHLNRVDAASINFVPQDGDSALHVVESVTYARLQMNVPGHVSAGFEYVNGRKEKSFPNAVDIPEMTAPAVRGGGVFIVKHFPSQRVTGVTVSIGAAVQMVGLPWEEWEAQTLNCDLICAWEDFVRIDAQVARKFRYRGGFGVAYEPEPHLLLHSAVSVQNAFTNTGFHIEPIEGSTIRSDIGGVFQFGLRAQVKWIFADIGGYLPFGYGFDTAVRGVGLFAGGGLRIPFMKAETTGSDAERH
ncbi:MAG: hypothetical protein D6761_03050 [Candidatus Dadabacteria bacterium]|nr:MAG: hypothetical protein D6761_03050 [Candidatus Dadabacteria bacterium]